MKQTRFIPIGVCGLKVREAGEGEQESRTVIGMPIVYGVRSVNLTPYSEDREVYEVLEPGFISPELLQRSDVILNLNHSNLVPDVLGRYRNSERDTLALELLPQGMACRCDLPHTNNANDTLELMKRGDITGMSFAFSDNSRDRESVEYEQTNERSADGKEIWIRHVKRATGFYDVSIVTHPAYEQTMVVTREFADEIMRDIDAQIDAIKREIDFNAQKQREAEEQAKREQEEREAKEREERELQEQEQRFRQQQAMRLRYKAQRLNDEIFESLNV